MEKQHQVTVSIANPQRQSTLYLEPRPTPGGLYPTHIKPHPWTPPPTHINENSDNFSIDNYDDFEFDIDNE